MKRKKAAADGIGEPYQAPFSVEGIYDSASIRTLVWPFNGTYRPVTIRLGAMIGPLRPLGCTWLPSH